MKKIFAILMVVAMIFAIAVPVCAEISPKPQPGVDTGVVPEDGGNVTDKDNGDGTHTITINPNKGHNFVKWEITGEYEIVNGKLTDTTITIKPLTDVKVNAVLKADSAKPSVKPGTSSPSTGVAPVMLAVAFVASVAGAGISFKKSK